MDPGGGRTLRGVGLVHRPPDNKRPGQKGKTNPIQGGVPRSGRERPAKNLEFFHAETSCTWSLLGLQRSISGDGRYHHHRG